MLLVWLAAAFAPPVFAALEPGDAKWRTSAALPAVGPHCPDQLPRGWSSLAKTLLPMENILLLKSKRQNDFRVQLSLERTFVATHRRPANVHADEARLSRLTEGQV